MGSKHFTACLRLKLDNSEEMKCWVQKFERYFTVDETLKMLNTFVLSLNKATFNVYRSSKNNGKYAFCEQLICQHSKSNKNRRYHPSNPWKNTDCKATLKLRLKQSTQNTRRKDAYMKMGEY